jgi:hypothetical protein
MIYHEKYFGVPMRIGLVGHLVLTIMIIGRSILKTGTQKMKTYLVSAKYFHQLTQTWIEIERLVKAPHSIAVRELFHDLGWRINSLIELTPKEIKQCEGLKTMSV